MPPTPFDSLVARARGEYREMPGLRLTVSQACRLWHVDVLTCEMLFEQLVGDGISPQNRKGRLYRATDDAQTNLTATRLGHTKHDLTV
jgi:hypothetical protein